MDDTTRVGLTTGTGPFGHRPAARLDFEPPDRVVLVEPWSRRVRAYAGDRAIVDSERTVLVYETGSLPHYAFPAEDVSVEAEPEPEVEGYVRVPWNAADRWLEEDVRNSAERRAIALQSSLMTLDVMRVCSGPGEELRSALEAASELFWQFSDDVEQVWFSHTSPSHALAVPGWVDEELEAR